MQQLRKSHTLAARNANLECRPSSGPADLEMKFLDPLDADLPSDLAMTLSHRQLSRLVFIRADCLYAAGCTKLKSVASGLEYHFLDLSGTPITSLPSKLIIKNELKLRNCTSLALIEEGATVAKAIDVRGCDMLFTLPKSIQPPIAITDGTMLANDWVVVPEMSAEEANMCLGFKGIEGFPSRHFKNLDRMQYAILSIERGGKGFRRGRAVGHLKSDRVRHGGEDFLRQLVQRLDDRQTLILSGPVQLKRLN